MLETGFWPAGWYGFRKSASEEKKQLRMELEKFVDSERFQAHL